MYYYECQPDEGLYLLTVLTPEGREVSVYFQDPCDPDWITPEDADRRTLEILEACFRAEENLYV